MALANVIRAISDYCSPAAHIEVTSLRQVGNTLKDVVAKRERQELRYRAYCTVQGYLVQEELGGMSQCIQAEKRST